MKRYRNIRGLPLNEEFMERMFSEAGVTEEQVWNFLGEEYASKNGAVLYLLQHLGQMKPWIEAKHEQFSTNQPD